MLQRKCFSKCCNFTSDICFIIPILVIMWTILSLRYTLLESDPILNIKSDQILTRFSNNEKNDFSDFFQETKILPEYKTYPEDIRQAIINAYNISYKELQKVVSQKEKTSPLRPGTMHVRLVLVSTWRSGSSFASELLVSHPGAYLQAEPLHYLGIRRIYSDSDVSKDDAYDILKNILKCNNTAFKVRIPEKKWPNIYWFQHEQNYLYHSQCANRLFLKNRTFCGNPKYLDGICTALPIQVTKIDRINLKYVSPLLEEDLKSKIFYLVRDPRAVIHSRKDFPWCVASPECIDSKYLCQDMLQDYHEAQRLLKISGNNNFKALRFEDFTLDMVRKAEELFDFMNLKLQPVSQDFIYKGTHPNTTQDLPHNVHIRDPATVVSKWWKKLSMPEVKKIQSNCKEAMELWGYMPIKNYNAKHELFDTNFKLK